MDFEKIWDKIVTKIKTNPQEIQTIPVQSNKIGVWFSVCEKNNDIYILPAKNNSPASKIKPYTRIPKNDFVKLLPIYLRRKRGEKVSEEAKKITRFQVYIYSIFNKYGEI